jgi:UDP-N-acetylmuramate dehydrogenase
LINFALDLKTIQEHISLKELNTFGLVVQAEYLQIFTTVQELKEILQSDLYKQQEHLILGGGSNILFTQDVKGLVLKNEIVGKEIIEEDDEHVLVKFGAGEAWHDCVLWAIKNDFGGIENLSFIPGTMGAAPMQNIGAYGVEIKSVLQEVEAVEKVSGEVRFFNKEECAFGYRESVFKRALKNKFVITHVTLKLTKQHVLNIEYGAIQAELENNNVTEPTIQDVSKAVIAIRESKLPNPKEIGNAGSFFKNPVVSKEVFDNIRTDYQDMPFYEQGDEVKIPAGWLIENAGWKGFVDGEIGVHKKQALVLVNYGKGAGLDIYNLSQQIIQDVQLRYGIVLEREVNIY